MLVDRIWYDVISEEATIKYADRRSKKKLGHIDVIKDNTSVQKRVRTSSKSVKYQFQEPVQAHVKETEESRKLNVKNR